MDIFDFSDYKAYLNARLDEPAHGGGRGARARLSKAMGCQTAYTAQVLRGSAHFSLEQGECINEFFGHTQEQGSFLLKLIQYSRAGTPKLRERFRREIEAVAQSRKMLKHRLGIRQPLTLEQQTSYYSSWYPAAIHALASVPGYQTVEKIADRLRLDRETTAAALQLLIEAGLLARAKTDKGETLEIGIGQIHLGQDSPLVAKHHINWRLQAIRALENPRADALHYSSVVSIADADRPRARKALVETLEKLKPMIRDSDPEALCCLAVDWFEV